MTTLERLLAEYVGARADVDALAAQDAPLVLPDARTMTHAQIRDYLNNDFRVEIARRRHRTNSPRSFGL